MKRSREEKRWSLGSVYLLCCLSASVSGSFPKAQNVSWESFDFKTILTWSPKPVNHSYTVEFSKHHEDNQRTPHCIQMSETECDLTNELTDLKGKYTADVLSEPVRGMSTDLVELPRSKSAVFCPYQETIISGPDFEIEVSKDKGTITLHIKDIKTAVFVDGKKTRTIQDIFKDDLKYEVTYRKAKSSGQKTKTSESSEIELTGLDKGVSYCFTVKVLIPSRTIKKYGESSDVHCSPAENTSFLEEYSYAVIAGGILVVIAIISAVIAIIVICYKRQQEAKNRGKEHVPLKGV